MKRLYFSLMLLAGSPLFGADAGAGDDFCTDATLLETEADAALLAAIAAMDFDDTAAMFASYASEVPPLEAAQRADTVVFLPSEPDAVLLLTADGDILATIDQVIFMTTVESVFTEFSNLRSRITLDDSSIVAIKPELTQVQQKLAAIQKVIAAIPAEKKGSWANGEDIEAEISFIKALLRKVGA